MRNSNRGIIDALARKDGEAFAITAAQKTQFRQFRDPHVDQHRRCGRASRHGLSHYVPGYRTPRRVRHRARLCLLVVTVEIAFVAPLSRNDCRLPSLRAKRSNLGPLGGIPE